MSVACLRSPEDTVMSNRKIRVLSFSIAVGVGLIGSLALVITILVEAVLRSQSFL
jgi:hypothetical protein